MMLCLALFGFAGTFTDERHPLRKIEVAFVAEIYPKAGAYDRSKPRVYVCGLHGENRSVVPGAVGEYKAVWLDADNLAWVEPHISGPDSEMVYSVNTGKTKVVAVGKSLGFPGSKAYWKKADREALWSEPWDTRFASTDKQYPASFGRSEDGQSWTLTQNGHTKQFKEGPPGGMLFDRLNNRVWFYDQDHISGSGTWRALYRLDWVKGKAIPIFRNVDDFDFSPSRDLFGAVDNFHLPPDAEHRWPKLAKAWIGNWRTGQHWAIVKGDAYAISIALRPQR